MFLNYVFLILSLIGCAPTYDVTKNTKPLFIKKDQRFHERKSRKQKKEGKYLLTIVIFSFNRSTGTYGFIDY